LQLGARNKRDQGYGQLIDELQRQNRARRYGAHGGGTENDAGEEVAEQFRQPPDADDLTYGIRGQHQEAEREQGARTRHIASERKNELHAHEQEKKDQCASHDPVSWPMGSSISAEMMRAPNKSLSRT